MNTRGLSKPSQRTLLPIVALGVIFLSAFFYSRSVHEAKPSHEMSSTPHSEEQATQNIGNQPVPESEDQKRLLLRLPQEEVDALAKQEESLTEEILTSENSEDIEREDAQDSGPLSWADRVDIARPDEDSVVVGIEILSESEASKSASQLRELERDTVEKPETILSRD